MNRQAKVISRLTDGELLLNLYLSQGIMLLVALFASRLLLGGWFEPFTLIEWNMGAVFTGLAVAAAVVLLEWLCIRILPAKWLDDGGINERIFKNRSVVHIAVISFVVAVSEEVLFRGVIQTSAGIIAASVLFALIHFRYLHHPFLFTFTVGLSFLLGYVYLITGNLLTVISAHFFIDAILGLAIKYGWFEKNGKNR
ncbi:CPBP family intramembrane glutamic endopeptidase [Alteribacter natronophilus]|uniref:CPBP family intramembrane glutamic endopeptidase n=1 Tax=Alteribacter natronophilus TaxID=2583810 RepID=UPI00110D26B2|nr:CPBP family intramembrane glutamic endopeptidase [Alteribacter natronophilus]TMW73634.1 CPBP family intramembrane metalloprotease [Alteribacter natronophilus]